MNDKDRIYGSGINFPGFDPVSSIALDKQPLWTVEDVARYLRLEAETVRIMARSGKLPAIKLGRVWRFRIQQIEEWVQQAAPKNTDNPEASEILS